MHEAAAAHSLLTVSEVMEIAQIESMLPFTDCFQVGARNMQNFNLLRELGQARKPVLLKRGMSATIEELLLSSEYILAGGNYDVILCERGIRTYETSTRNTMDIAAIPGCTSSRIFPLWAIRHTAPDAATWFRPWRKLPWPQVQTQFSSKSIPIPTRRLQTGRRHFLRAI